MKILVISDSHGKNDDVERVISQVKNFDVLIHLGDIERGDDFIRSLVSCPVYMVKGNNDYRLELPNEEIIELEGYRFFLTHGHRYYVNRGNMYLEEYAKEHEIDVVLHGHTHVPTLYKEGDLTIACPGSISYPRQSNNMKTFLSIEIDKAGEIHFSYGSLESELEKIYEDLFRFRN